MNYNGYKQSIHLIRESMPSVTRRKKKQKQRDYSVLFRLYSSHSFGYLKLWLPGRSVDLRKITGDSMFQAAFHIQRKAGRYKC